MAPTDRGNVHASAPELRVGFMPGSFDPPHRGHLELAERARGELNLDRVYFYVNSLNIYKPGISSLSHRRAMVELMMDGVVMRSVPEAAYQDHAGDERHDFLEDMDRLRKHIAVDCTIVMIRGSDYFHPDLIERYPAALWSVPHVIGVRDPGHLSFDFSRFGSVRIIRCSTATSTEARQCLGSKSPVNPGLLARMVEQYCLDNELYK